MSNGTGSLGILWEKQHDASPRSYELSVVARWIESGGKGTKGREYRSEKPRDHDRSCLVSTILQADATLRCRKRSKTVRELRNTLQKFPWNSLLPLRQEEHQLT